ncbi:copper homeostasis protein CutC [Muriicola marianensis]|uniref:PF03932 family protein CutC n=1 Tax=Muriicola marianensis TaxID=1324801 RepID=A0ABQ1QUD2_9FLAO|nr:copper homeostasis protein CutC [Muriicola marianensis]GGD46574.1 copper homeostasis protein CutC [Muriicola marianensis]
MTVEVCVTSLESALLAQQAGAQRIELCAELSLGGITPSIGLISTVREAIQIPVHVLIRPRSGDFTYSEQEFTIMLRDIESCRSQGVDGIVAGVLERDMTVDWERTSELLHHSEGMSFTFHRAFDWVPDPAGTFLRLQELGVHTLLTSGQAQTAEKGIGVLQELLNLSSGCVVMPGGGINARNASLFEENGFAALHLSASRQVVNTPKTHPLIMRSSNFPPENHVLQTDPEILRKVIESVN